MIPMSNDMNFRMNPDIKAQWVAALRSGDYRQGREQLHTYDEEIKIERYCCLGVLCDLAIKAGVVESKLLFADGRAKKFGPVGGADYEFESGELPEIVSKWAGLSVTYDPYDIGEDAEVDYYSNPSVTDGPGRISLAEANDEKAYDFRRIADLIEASL